MTEPVLRFEQLCKRFADKEVLRHIDAEARVGDVIGLVGLNGAGKTTLLEAGLGFTPPSAGCARVFGRESIAELNAATKARIGFVPQRDELLENISGKRYLKLIASFYSHWNDGLIERLSREWAVPLEQKTSTLSLGQKQKLSILAALGHEPELIVLDEPVASLDPMARRQFLRELVDIASSHTRTIVFSTHIVSDLERVASRVWFLKGGALAIDEELDELKERCARVHLPPRVALPEALRGDRLLQHRREQGAEVLLFHNLDAAQQSALEAAAGCSLQPEWLSLEDIFLELHA